MTSKFAQAALKGGGVEMTNHPNRKLPRYEVRDPIIILSVPHRGDPRTWIAYGVDDYIVRASRAYISSTVYEQTTVAKLLECFGEDDLPEIAGGIQIASLAPDTVLYRADYLCGAGEYQVEAIDELEAIDAAEAHDVSGWYRVNNPAEYHDLIERLTGPQAPRIGQCGPLRAAWALRRAALNLGWIAENQDADAAEIL